MAEADRRRWDQRYAAGSVASGAGSSAPPTHLAEVVDLLPAAGTALVLAFGRGEEVRWAARRGFDPVFGWDVSPVAVDLAIELVEDDGVADRCHLAVADLDDGLPVSPPADLVICHLFRDPRLDDAIIDRLSPGGVLALACLSEVGAGPGPFRAPAGALLDAFSGLDVLDHREADGVASIVAVKRWTGRD